MKPQRLDLCYHIRWQGRWHVGSGYQSAVADRLLRRLPNDEPFIPGSQIKGSLRHQCERLAQALGLKVVNPHAGIKEDEKNLIKHFTPLKKSNLMVDRLFGSRYQGECLFVTNAEPLSSEEKSMTSVQTRTAIDRVTGTVKEDHLFTTELAEDNVELQGKIRARHPAGVLTQEEEGAFPYEYDLLIAALLSLDALGGDKSHGLGRCKIKIESLCWKGECISCDEVLQSFQEEEWSDWVDILREGSQ